MTEWRNRIKEQRTVTATELRANPLNWRKHPQQQANAIRGLLSEVGIVAPLIAYHSERANGALTLIDGHMRQETGGAWPCVILDVTDAEADLVLASFDPITGMAETDAAVLDALLREVNTGDAALQEMLAGLAEDAGLDYASEADESAGVDNVPEQWAVMVQCTTEIEQAELLQRLDAEGYSCRALIS